MQTDLPPELEHLAGRLLAAAREVYRELGPGMRERIYRDALAIALADASIPVRDEVSIDIEFRGRRLGAGYRMDLLVAERIVVEVKSAAEMHPAFESQLLTYMKGAQAPLGFVLNFGMPTLSAGIRRMIISGLA